MRISATLAFLFTLALCCLGQSLPEPLTWRQVVVGRTAMVSAENPLEALAAARPVVSTAVGGVPEVVIAGQTGLTSPDGDSTAIGDAVLRLLREPDLAARLGNAGRRHVYPRYDSSRLVADVKQLYLRELAAQGRAVSSTGVSA